MITAIITRVEREVEIPSTPNFIRFGKKDQDVAPVGSFSKADLEKIADAWKSNLLERAGH